MKHWNEKQTNSDGEHRILLIDGDMDRVVSIGINEERNVVIRERCDRYFRKECSKAEAIEALQEAIDWLKSL